MHTETHQEAALTVELRDEQEAVSVVWSGRSTMREPARFVLPLLLKAVDLSSKRGKPLVLDFQNIGYMNSSTITPIIRVLDRAMRGSNAVRVLYRRDLKWQALSFTALEVFQTRDKRIEICGV